ncbi:glycosyltransferase family protein [Akkermansiaceae bacterium]|nr:glycosyltransferase family protein [Akkermansiaceae bacterium]
MTSSRLPGKVLMNAVDDISMLEFMIHRVRQSALIDDIIVATTTNKEDNPIVALCEKLDAKSYRGSEDDVLMRVLEAHTEYHSDIIVELTGDCPLIDHQIIDQVIQVYLEGDYDYVSNSHVRSFPMGLDVEVFAADFLRKIEKIAITEADREHVSLYMYNSNKFKTKEVIAPDNLFWPELRITLDDWGDYDFIKRIIAEFYPQNGFKFLSHEIILFIKANPNLLELLKDVRKSDHSNEATAQR